MPGLRGYTILVVGNGAEILRRFSLSHRSLIATLAGGFLVGTLGLLSWLVILPLTASWLEMRSRVDALEMQNRVLLNERVQIDDWISEIGERLEEFEAKSVRLSALAEIVGAPVERPAGGPTPGEGEPDSVAGTGGRSGIDVAGSEELETRAFDIRYRLDRLESTLLRQADRLASYPLLRPADGRDGDGFGRRRDPFTGRPDFHGGIDIVASYGSPVRAPGEGVVTLAGTLPGYGRTIVLSHTSGIDTRYGHLSRIFVKPGNEIGRGEIIGLVGNSGRSMGAHLHYEIIVNGRRVNPDRFLKALKRLDATDPSS